MHTSKIDRADGAPTFDQTPMIQLSLELSNQRALHAIIINMGVDILVEIAVSAFAVL